MGMISTGLVINHLSMKSPKHSHLPTEEAASQQMAVKLFLDYGQWLWESVDRGLCVCVCVYAHFLALTARKFLVLTQHTRVRVGFEPSILCF